MKPGLSSRRQQSEPPVNRNVFPPTPPPENEARLPSRGASVRSGSQKPVLAKLQIQTQDPGRKYEKAMSPPDGRSRPGRSASANPVRGYSQREPAPIQRRPTIQEDEEAYPGEVYDMYSAGAKSNASRGSNRMFGRPRQQQRYADEEDEGSDYDGGSIDEGEFEMIPQRRAPPSSSSGSTRTGSRRAPELRQIRVKVHAAEDVRYIAVAPASTYNEFTDRVKDKFGLRRRFKIKVKDDDMPDGDMITMGDQDDWEMTMQSVKQQARKQRVDQGRLDVSTSRVQLFITLLTLFLGLDLRGLELIYPKSMTYA